MGEEKLLAPPGVQKLLSAEARRLVRTVGDTLVTALMLYQDVENVLVRNLDQSLEAEASEKSLERKLMELVERTDLVGGRMKYPARPGVTKGPCPPADHWSQRLARKRLGPSGSIHHLSTRYGLDLVREVEKRLEQKGADKSSQPRQ